MRLLPYEFSDKKVTPWGGLRIVQELYLKSGLRSIIEELPLKNPESNRGYNPIDMIEGFMMSVILGSKRLSHSGLLRHDEVIQKMFGWKKGMASQSTFSRFFRKQTEEDNKAIFPELQKKWFDQFDIGKLTLDIDSTVLSRYGNQEGVTRGYNPGKKGRGSHHPVLAFVAELKMVANAWMRNGNTGSLTDFEDFFNETLEIIPKEKIGLVRADSGFFGDKPLNLLEDNDINYIVSAHFKPRLRQRIMDEKKWVPLDEGKKTTMDFCSFDWQSDGWKNPRRFVILRKDYHENPKAGGKILFPDLEEFEKYRYVAFVTNLDIPPTTVWQLYNQRADAENRIKELKYEYGIEGFCLKDMQATEHVFRWIMVAHNLMSLFRLKLLSERKNTPVLSSINFQCIAIGCFLNKKNRTEVLKLSLDEKRRNFIDNIFQKLGNISPPFTIPIA
jgi:hypothetical protein